MRNLGAFDSITMYKQTKSSVQVEYLDNPFYFSIFFLLRPVILQKCRSIRIENHMAKVRRVVIPSTGKTAWLYWNGPQVSVNDPVHEIMPVLISNSTQLFWNTFMNQFANKKEHSLNTSDVRYKQIMIIFPMYELRKMLRTLFLP